MPMAWKKDDKTGEFAAVDRADLQIRPTGNKKKFELLQAGAVIATGTLLQCQNTAETTPTPQPPVPEPTAQSMMEVLTLPSGEKKHKKKGKKAGKTETPPEPTQVLEPEQILYKIKARGTPWKQFAPIFAPGVAEDKVRAIEPPKDLSKQELFAFFERTLDWYESREIYCTNAALKSLFGYITVSGPEKHGVDSLTIRHPDLAVARDLNRKRHEELALFWEDLMAQRGEPVEYTSAYREQQWMARHKLTPGAGPAGVNDSGTPSTTVVNKTAEVGGATVHLDSSTGDKGGRRFNFMGLPITSVLRWMGHRGWSKKQVRKVMDDLGIEVKDATIQAQVQSGRKGNDGPHGKIPELTKEQEKAIDDLYETVKAIA